MRERVAPFYWAAGALAGFGLIGLMTLGGRSCSRAPSWPSSGSPLLRTRGAWAFFAGFGGLPVIVFLLHISNGVRTALNPYCAEMGKPGAQATGAADPGPVSVSCSFVPASYYAMFAVFAAVALFGVALGRLPRRTGRRAAST